MADKSAIEWTDATWNPIVGCSIVSPGCTNCYAMGMAARIEAMTAALRKDGGSGAPHYDGTTKRVKGIPVWTGKVALAPEHILTEPLRWKRPRRIFVNSMGDLFHEDVPFGWVMRVMHTMGHAQQHTFQILTKRPDRMREFFARWSDVNPAEDWDFQNARGPEAVRKAHSSGRGQLFADMLDSMGEPPPGAAYPTFDWMEGMSRWPNVLPNVWLGVSAEDQQRADERIPDLLATPAAVRFVSAEPLLGPIDFTLDIGNGMRWNALGRTKGGQTGCLDWIIVGGESGPKARPMHPAWARSIRDQCQAAGVPFFFKQWGEHRPLTDAEHGQACGATLIGSDPHDRDAYVLRVRKKLAGRLLDGVEHNGFPEVA